MGQPTFIIKTTVRLQKQVTVYVFRSRCISRKVITPIPPFPLVLEHVSLRRPGLPTGTSQFLRIWFPGGTAVRGIY